MPQTTPNGTADPPRVPLVLGVVGHRDFHAHDRKRLSDALERTFREFAQAYLHTPLVLLSALAEGADQLAAEVALGLKRHPTDPIDIEVRAPLPFPPAVYERSSSFGHQDDGTQTPSGQAAQKQFREWICRRQVEHFLVPLPNLADPNDTASWEVLRQDATARRRCYANVGGYIVHHCDVLIALWDGAAARGAGGTADFVNFKRRGKPPALYPHWEPLGHAADIGPVCVLHTLRGVGAATVPAGTRLVYLPGEEEPLREIVLARRVGEGERFRWRMYSALGLETSAHAGRITTALRQCAARVFDEEEMSLNAARELRQFLESCLAVEDFNSDVMGARDRLKQPLRGIERRLLGAKAADRIQLPKKLTEIGRLRETAGALSRGLEALVTFRLRSLFLIIFAAAACFHFYTHAFRHFAREDAYNPAMLALYLGTLLTAGVVVWAVWWTRLDKRRLDYRALAEALRVRFYWALAGLERSVADSYLGQMRGEMAWARRALQHVCPPPPSWKVKFAALSKPEQLDRLKVAWFKWVVGQERYFRRESHKRHRAATLCRLSGFVLAVFGWLLAASLLFGWFKHEVNAPADANAPVEEPAEGWFEAARHPRHGALIFSGLLVVGGGLLLAFCERRSHEDLAHQFQRLQTVFREARRELKRHLQAGNVAEAQTVMDLLGREAITEHAQWLILRRARPVELPIG